MLSGTKFNGSISELCSDLIDNHHAYIRREGPRLLRQLPELKHRTDAPLMQIGAVLRTMLQELEPHMLKEEAILFPYCQRLELASEPFVMHCGSVANPIRAMSAEHADCQLQLAQLAELTQNYLPAPEDHPAYAKWLQALQDFSEDLKLHIHKEDHLLFPQALELEARLSAQTHQN